MAMAIQTLKDWENIRQTCRGMKAIAQNNETARILVKIPMRTLGLPIDKAIAFFPKFFEQLPPQMSLDLSNCQYKSLKSKKESAFEGITALTTLRELNAASTHTGNNDIVYLSPMTTLKSLNLSNTRVSQLPSLSTLESLDLQNCRHATSATIDKIRMNTSLKSLNLGLCLRLNDNDIKKLNSMTGLTSLQLDGVPFSDQVLVDLASLTNLIRLGFNGCSFNGAGLENLHLPKLQELDLSYMNNLQGRTLNHLSGLTSLTSLNLNSAAPKITTADLNFLRYLPHLQKLDLQGADLSGGLAVMNALTRLEDLNLETQRLNIDSVAEINRLTRLQKLNLKGSTVGGQGLKPLTFFGSLRSLNLSACPKLEDPTLMPLTSLSKLSDLDLSRNKALTDQAFLAFEPWTSLRTLKFNENEIQGEGLVYLSTTLRALDLEYCSKMKSGAVVHLQAMTHLDELNVRFCESITKNPTLEMLKKALGGTHIKPERKTVTLNGS